MLTIDFTLEGIAPISFSKVIQSQKNTGEAHDAFEERTWRERMHTDEDGNVIVPPTMIKNCLGDCAKYLSESVPGKGKATYTKHFEAGMIVPAHMLLMKDGKPIKGKDVDGNRLFVPSDGKRGGGKRVYKWFPTIPPGWQISGEIIILDPLLEHKPDKVREYLTHAGQFIGIGTFRPRNNGFFGRFKVVECNWSKNGSESSHD
jgi:hypothetical protein